MRPIHKVGQGPEVVHKIPGRGAYGYQSGVEKLTRSNLKGVSKRERQIWPFLRQVSLSRIICLRGDMLLAFCIRKGPFFEPPFNQQCAN